jgi:hypothetical protein
LAVSSVSGGLAASEPRDDQDAFTDDPISVGEWLAANQTSTELFSELVAALRLQNESELVKLTQDNLGDALLENILMKKYLPKTV